MPGVQLCSPAWRLNQFRSEMMGLLNGTQEDIGQADASCNVFIIALGRQFFDFL